MIDRLHALALASLTVAIACALVITFDLQRHRQQMWIMDLVWPIAALFGSLAVLFAYFKYGRLATKQNMMRARLRRETPPSATQTPFAVKVAKGTLHCGSGCALGDIVAEWLAFAVPGIAVWFGFKSIFAEKMFAVWVLDYIFAFGLGIVFQYFTIAPMRGLQPAAGLWAAIKADALSLTSWQLGMYGFMALAKFYLFRHLLGQDLRVDSAEFWFMMQIAMICGFVTAYPANWLLIRSGLKEAM